MRLMLRPSSDSSYPEKPVPCAWGSSVPSETIQSPSVNQTSFSTVAARFFLRTSSCQMRADSRSPATPRYSEKPSWTPPQKMPQRIMEFATTPREMPPACNAVSSRRRAMMHSWMTVDSRKITGRICEITSGIFTTK